MSNFVIAVGGSGAKLMQSLIYLGGAGLLPAGRRELFAVLVDPDENNGNMEECQALAKSYTQCAKLLSTGSRDLFSASIHVEGPWTPLQDGQVDTLSEIFQYDKLAHADAQDADLLELFFEAPDEINMSIKQGFRGRPAIGATVFAQAVRFDQSPWRELKEKINARSAQGNVRTLLAGSVFGGSGASGVPTLVRLLRDEFAGKVANLKMGLVLFLPFFQFRPVKDEDVQADPAGFPMATAEALKYYHERGFLTFCDSIYCVGEQVPSQLAVSAVGAAEQRNEAHFVELVAGMGAMRFFNDQLASTPAGLAVAGRRSDNTVSWDDLPYDEHRGQDLVRKLQHMATFAVAYKYVFFPVIDAALASGKSEAPFWVDHIERRGVNRDEAGRALRELYDYTGRFLQWWLQISTPRRGGFTPGMVNPNVFAARDGEQWRLKRAREFNDADFPDLLLNRPARSKLDTRTIFRKATHSVSDKHAAGAGRLVRALYDACAVA
jgi:hypothetical protein